MCVKATLKQSGGHLCSNFLIIFSLVRHERIPGLFFIFTTSPIDQQIPDVLFDLRAVWQFIDMCQGIERQHRPLRLTRQRRYINVRSHQSAAVKIIVHTMLVIIIVAILAFQHRGIAGIPLHRAHKSRGTVHMAQTDDTPAE